MLTEITSRLFLHPEDVQIVYMSVDDGSLFIRMKDDFVFQTSDQDHILEILQGLSDHTD
jgi:hypothetical protein